MSMSRAAAEEFALQVIAWLGDDHARIAGFLAWSGETPDGLRARLQDPALLLAAVEFLMLDEAQLLNACQELDFSPQTPMMARAALPGGDEMHWT